MRLFPICLSFFLLLALIDATFIVVEIGCEANRQRFFLAQQEILLLIVHIIIIVVEVVAIIIAIYSTYWIEGMIFHRVGQVLQYNFPFFLLHLLLTLLVFLLGHVIIPSMEVKRLWGSPLYVVFQFFQFISFSLQVLSGLFVFGVLSEKNLYPPFSMHLRTAVNNSKNLGKTGSPIKKRPRVGPDDFTGHASSTGLSGSTMILRPSGSEMESILRWSSPDLSPNRD